LPALVLTYIHDHSLWRDEPLTVIAVTFALSLALGVGVGFLQTYFTPGILAAPGHGWLPPLSRIAELGLLMPVVAFVAALFAPLLVTAREAFRHPMDVVVTCALSGAALSLGWSVVVQHGAFTHLQATAGDPARVAFIALTLGFLQPVIVATAAAVAVLGLRSDGVNPAVAVIEGLALMVLYGLAVTLLAPYGARGVVLTTFAAMLLAGAGLVAARTALHTAVDTAPEVSPVQHRLHGAVVAAIVAVVAIVAAGVTAAVVLRGPSTPPTPPTGPGGLLPKAHATATIHPAGGQRRPATLVLASTSSPLAAGSASTVDLGNGVTLTVAPGWTIANQSQGEAVVANGDHSAQLAAVVDTADRSDIGQESAALNDAFGRGAGLTNVQQAPQGGVQTFQGRNFTQGLQVNFTGDLQTNQGTVQLYGNWVTLFNPSTRIVCFVALNAMSPDALNAAEPDGESMLASVI
jgi:hypothetical protein